MNNLQKIGGISALINSAAYIVGFTMIFTLLAPILDSKPEQYLAFLAGNQTLMVVWYIIIYLITGVFMVPLSLALHERLKDGAPAMMQITTAFGLIWAVTVIISGMLMVNNVGVVTQIYNKDPTQAVTVMLTLGAVERGIGGAIELPGGLWALLVSLVALRIGGLPKILSYFGVAVGVGGIATIVPALGEGASVFGLGMIVWFAWVGVVMVRVNQA